MHVAYVVRSSPVLPENQECYIYSHRSSHFSFTLLLHAPPVLCIALFHCQAWFSVLNRNFCFPVLWKPMRRNPWMTWPLHTHALDVPCLEWKAFRSAGRAAAAAYRVQTMRGIRAKWSKAKPVIMRRRIRRNRWRGFCKAASAVRAGAGSMAESFRELYCCVWRGAQEHHKQLQLSTARRNGRVIADGASARAGAGARGTATASPVSAVAMAPRRPPAVSLRQWAMATTGSVRCVMSSVGYWAVGIWVCQYARLQEPTSLSVFPLPLQCLLPEQSAQWRMPGRGRGGTLPTRALQIIMGPISS